VPPGAAEEPLFEAPAPASPLFDRLVGIERSRPFRVQVLGVVGKQLLGGVPALPVDAAQLKGAGIHLFPESPVRLSGARPPSSETWPFAFAITMIARKAVDGYLEICK